MVPCVQYLLLYSLSSTWYNLVRGTQGVGQAMQVSAGDFSNLGVRSRRGLLAIIPARTPSSRQYLRTGGRRLGIPSSRVDGDLPIGRPRVGAQSPPASRPNQPGAGRATARSVPGRGGSRPRWARPFSQGGAMVQRVMPAGMMSRARSRGHVETSARGSSVPAGSRTTPQRPGSTGGPIRAHTAVPLGTSRVRWRRSAQRPRGRCQRVWGSFRICFRCGRCSPLTRGGAGA